MRRWPIPVSRSKKTGGQTLMSGTNRVGLSGARRSANLNFEGLKAGEG